MFSFGFHDDREKKMTVFRVLLFITFDIVFKIYFSRRFSVNIVGTDKN